MTLGIDVSPLFSEMVMALHPDRLAAILEAEYVNFLGDLCLVLVGIKAGLIWVVLRNYSQDCGSETRSCNDIPLPNTKPELVNE